MNKKKYIIPECELVLLAPTMHLAAGSVPVDSNNSVDNSNVSGGTFELGSKDGDTDTWDTWED